MATDTRDKRASVLGVSSSAPRLEQNPSGFIRRSGRHIAALIYSGITIQVITPTFSNSNSTTRLLSSTDAKALLR